MAVAFNVPIIILIAKIDLSDEVLVLNVGGYIGESTRKEIEYAERTGKPVHYAYPEPKENEA